MDWRLIGAVAGFVALAGGTAAAVSFVYHSPTNVLLARKVSPSPTLVATAPPRIVMDPPRISAEPILPPPPPPLLEARTEPAGGGIITEGNNQYPADDLAKPPSSSDHAARLPAPHKQTARLSSPPEHPKPPPAVAAAPPPPPKKIVQEWKAVPTERAGPFNLGGHIDHNGVVDSAASERLREALKASKNYRRIPAEAKAWIEAPNINLSKLAPYRVMLGIDDRIIEAEQGVRFVRLFASTRGIDDEADLDADMAELPPGIAKGDIEPLVLPLIR